MAVGPRPPAGSATAGAGGLGQRPPAPRRGHHPQIRPVSAIAPAPLAGLRPAPFGPVSPGPPREHYALSSRLAPVPPPPPQSAAYATPGPEPTRLIGQALGMSA